MAWFVAAVAVAVGLTAAGCACVLWRRCGSLRLEADEARAAAAEAEAAGKAKGEFLANMSHEIRTPLNGILGMTELVLDTKLSAEQRDYLTTLQSSAESLLRLLNDILDLSKVESGKLVLEPVDFPLRDSLANTLNPLALRAQGKGVELAYEVQSRVPDGLVGDVHRLQQVLVNLVGNAIKFTDQGEIVVRAYVKSREKSDDGDRVVVEFSVADTGIGIPEEKLAGIFRPFEQADASTTRRFGGTGLGLAIATQLVEQMGGRIWAESTVGRGTTFYFNASFGVGSARSAPVARTQLGLIPDLPVLVVDDNAAKREILEQMLVDWQTEPDGAPDGDAALAALDRSRSAGEPYGLVIADEEMPGMTGVELCERIKADAVHGRTPVVLMTAANRPGGPNRAAAAGADANLLKPVKPSLLARAIVTAVLGTDRHLPPSANSGTSATQQASATPPLSILLAEDNAVNQKFAVRLLEKRGHKVTIAGNGREAVENAGRGGFDLVLMDVQMPEIDGLEATRQIRSQQAGEAPPLVIIAMTANAQEEDRKACLEAGMDGYLTKPIDSKQLFAEIDRLTAGREPGATPAEPTSTALATTADLVDREALLARVDGDHGFLAETCEMFREDTPPLVEQLNRSLQEQDAEAAAAAAHRLKGMVSNFCAASADELIGRIEQAARMGELSAVPPLLQELDALLATLGEELETIVSKDAAS